MSASIPLRTLRTECGATARSELPAFDCKRVAYGRDKERDAQSCNYMAEEYPVNRFCLVDDLDTALAMVHDFATGNCEPGPYCVVEVWMQGPGRRA